MASKGSFQNSVSNTKSITFIFPNVCIFPRIICSLLLRGLQPTVKAQGCFPLARVQICYLNSKTKEGTLTKGNGPFFLMSLLFTAQLSKQLHISCKSHRYAGQCTALPTSLKQKNTRKIQLGQLSRLLTVLVICRSTAWETRRVPRHVCTFSSFL